MPGVVPDAQALVDAVAAGIGRDTDAVVRHMTSALPVHYEMGQGDARLCGVFVEISEDTGLANRIERIELADR